MPNQRHKLKLTKTQFKQLLKDRHFHDRSVEAARKVLCEGATYQAAGDSVGMTKQQVWGIVKDLRGNV